MLSREENLKSLKEDNFDLLVIGGGATGAGVALDAVLRGFKVALVEREDFSSGTSSRSTKLIHGGIRYLENAFTHLDITQLLLVVQGLKERRTLLQIAPHLTRTVPIVIPVYSWLDAAYYLFGIKIYDLLAGKKKIASSSFLSKDEVVRDFPAIKTENLKGGVQFFDGQFDDARMNLAIILTALKHGASAANYLEVIGFEKKDGRLTSALVRDHISGNQFSIKAKVYVNAGGPFSNEIRTLDNPEVKRAVRGSVGTHILLEKRFTPCGKGLLIPKTTDGRVLFLLPWKGASLVGTTDLDTEIQRDPLPSEEEIQFLMDHLNCHLVIKISHDEIKASWSGIRPLASTGNGKSRDLSRGYKIIRDPSGLYSLVGGKWTAYRKMAEKCLDEILAHKDLTSSYPCKTESTLLVGGEGYSSILAEKLSLEYGLDKEIASHLAQSYGNKAKKVISLATTPSLKARIVENHPYLGCEILYAIRYEMACTPLDILYRRTRLATIDQVSALSAIPKVIALMGSELGWSTTMQQEQLIKTKDKIELKWNA